MNSNNLSVSDIKDVIEKYKYVYNNNDLINCIIDKIMPDILEILTNISKEKDQLIKYRQSEGIKRAKDSGVKFGRPRKINVLTEDFHNAKTLYLKKELSGRKAAKLCNMNVNTFLRRVKESNDQ